MKDEMKELKQEMKELKEDMDLLKSSFVIIAGIKAGVGGFETGRYKNTDREYFLDEWNKAKSKLKELGFL